MSKRLYFYDAAGNMIGMVNSSNDNQENAASAKSAGISVVSAGPVTTTAAAGAATKEASLLRANG